MDLVDRSVLNIGFSTQIFTAQLYFHDLRASFPPLKSLKLALVEPLAGEIHATSCLEVHYELIVGLAPCRRKQAFR